MSSSNPKTVFTAAVVIFNHVLTFKRDMASLSNKLFSLVQAITELLSTCFKEGGLTDTEAVTAILLAETRMIYKNHSLTLKIQGEIVDKFVFVHENLRKRATEKPVQEAIDDILALIGV